MITTKQRLKEIEEKCKNYTNVKEFYAMHPYLYRWSLKHGIDVKKYLPKRKIISNYKERANKGIDCYLFPSNKFYKHYPFIMDALRDLGLTYYYVHKVMDGEIEAIDGYRFVKCESDDIHSS